MKNFIAALILFTFGLTFTNAQNIRANVHAQTATNPPAASGYVVDLTWTASTSCTTTAPCTYTVYREITGSSSYVLVGTTPSQAVSYTDSTIALGLSYTYEVEAVQGSNNSAPSNSATVVVPNGLAAPTGVTATTAAH